MTNTRSRKDTQIGIRFDKATREQLERLAAKENRRLSDFIRVLIVESLRRRKAA